jgi:hypothetical protein
LRRHLAQAACGLLRSKPLNSESSNRVIVALGLIAA